MSEIATYPPVYIDEFEESFALQLEELDRASLPPKVLKHYLRNLLCAMELQFADRKQSLEPATGALKDLRAAAALMRFDMKAPVAREYLEELAGEVIAELRANYSA